MESDGRSNSPPASETLSNLPVTFYELDNDPKFVEALDYMLGIGAFAGDSLITFGKRLSFLHDPSFIQSLEDHPKNYARAFVWRLHVACWAAATALGLDGDFVECGVHEGMTSSMITNYLNFADVPKQYYLYDTFGGIPAGYMAELDPAHNHADYRKPGLYEEVLQRFAHYRNVRIISGELPGAFQQACPARIAFVHMDLGNFPSERDCLAFLMDRMVARGVVLFHTFGWEVFGGYKIADEPLLRDRGLNVLELPTGQGLLIVN